MFRQAGNVVVTVWKDKRLVYVMSMNCNPTSNANVKRKPNKVIKQSLKITTYNNYMGGVDEGCPLLPLTVKREFQTPFVQNGLMDIKGCPMDSFNTAFICVCPSFPFFFKRMMDGKGCSFGCLTLLY